MFYEITPMYNDRNETVYNVNIYHRFETSEILKVDSHFGATTWDDAEAIARLLIAKRRVVAHA